MLRGSRKRLSNAEVGSSTVKVSLKLGADSGLAVSKLAISMGHEVDEAASEEVLVRVAELIVRVGVGAALIPPPPPPAPAPSPPEAVNAAMRPAISATRAKHRQ